MEAVAASATAVQRLQPDTVYCREPRVQRPRDRMKNVQDGDCLLSGLAFSRPPRPPYPHFLESRSNFSFLEARGTQGGPGGPLSHNYLELQVHALQPGLISKILQKH